MSPKMKDKGPLKNTRSSELLRDTQPPLLSREEPSDADEEGTEDWVQTQDQRPRVGDLQPSEVP